MPELLQLVDKLGVSQSARLLGVSYSTVYRWAQGKTRPMMVGAVLRHLKSEARK
jgi:DNA-binding transcriptional regulator YiaG